MKISLVSPDAIRRHQANSSPSKYACSFSRQQRFKNPNPEYSSLYHRCKVHFYINNQSKFSKVKYSVGLGKRSDFTTVSNDAPPSTKYSHKSLFEKDLRKGSSFGLGRDSSPDKTYLNLAVLKNPAPNKVSINLLSMNLKNR